MGLIHVFTVLLNRVDKILNRLRETFNHSRFAEYPHAGLYYSPAYALIEQKRWGSLSPYGRGCVTLSDMG